MKMANMAYRKIVWRLLRGFPGLHLRRRLLLMLMLPFKGLASRAAIVLLLRAAYTTVIVEGVQATGRCGSGALLVPDARSRALG